MRQHLMSLGILLGISAAGIAADPLPAPMITGLKNPESVATGTDGRIYISTIGDFDKDGDGAIMVVQDGKAVPFVTGLDDPKGIVAFQEWLFVADKKRVLRVDRKGKATVFAPASAFPIPPLFLNDITADEKGTLYVSDSGDLKGGGGAIFSIDLKGKVSLITDAKRNPALKTPNGVLLDGMSFLLMVDYGSGELLRIKIADGTSTKIAEGIGKGDGLIWDQFGRLYISDVGGGRVFVIPRPGDKPILLAEGLKSAADIGIDPTGKFILVPDMKAGTIVPIRIRVPGQDFDDSFLPVATEPAFPNLQWTGWKSVTDKGQIVPLRPIMLTHAGDGSNRVFVPTEHGVIHVFANDQKAAKTSVFLDIQDRVSYDDKQNEEGFLGLAFHPRYKENGEFFVFYTVKKPKLTNVVSRFKVSKDDPNRADPASEEELMRFTRPFWNHDGGTIAFGPDGFLYVAHGDGGSFNDPHRNGQNKKTMLGKIHRIDVDKKAEGKNYAIPKDNPFVGEADARPEIWAYGLRNVWRMSFDRKTGQLWAADVGQNLYEEIDLIVKGGNYGWNLREGLHPFGLEGVAERKNLIDPIWEYHHDTGKSITGGHVYRGQLVPELEGYYLYGDYVTAKIWGLRYDGDKKRAVANRPIASPNVPIMSFGEDEKGEVYFMTYSPTGKGIYRFVSSKK